MTDPVNAADVLADAVITLPNDDPDIDGWQVKSLLAYGGGDPVVVMPDGRLFVLTGDIAIHRWYLTDPVQP